MFHWKLPHKAIRCQLLLCLNQEVSAGSQSPLRALSGAEQQSCVEPSAPHVLPWLATWIDYCAVWSSKAREKTRTAWKERGEARKKMIYSWLPVRRNPVFWQKKPKMLCTFQGRYEETCGIPFSLFHVTASCWCMWKSQGYRNTE